MSSVDFASVNRAASAHTPELCLHCGKLFLYSASALYPK